MSKSSVPVFLSILGIVAFAALAVMPASGDITSTRGLPVDGEVSGVITESYADESGLTEVYIESDNEDLGTLILTNGNPATGANDLEQFSAILESRLSCGGQMVLQAMNGNVIAASSAPVVPTIVCCDRPRNRCFKTTPAKCATKGTNIDPSDGAPFTSFADCTANCK
ncbi:MAG: hypothetical protein K0U98_08130 [Deltaproteobacteria bacterium]|nr:hypothetical protein [Deltaproteobacteria bacterium]